MRTAKTLAMVLGWLAAVLCTTAAQQTQPFQIQTTYLPLPVVGQPYDVQLRAVGGKPPYKWTLLRPLPEGLQLSESGHITGVASRGGPPLPPVLVQVEDSGTPPLVETRLLQFGTGGPLAMEWTTAPSIAGDAVSGSLKVTNGSGDVVTLTVIVVAVNSTGKAFALRYDHEDLVQQAMTAPLDFIVTLPPGDYVVHADAVAEVARKNDIYRARIEVGGLSVGN